LQTLSFTTDGYTPSPKKVRLVPFTPICEGSEAEGYPVFRALLTFQDPEIRPGQNSSSRITNRGQTALRERKIDARIAHFCATTPLLATLVHFMGEGGGG
jgi:hypothetical protein